MSRVNGAIYAPGSDPDKAAGNPKNNTALVAPAPYQYPSHGYGYGGYGQGQGYGHGRGHNHMIPLPPPCDSREGSALLNRGALRIEWANAGVNVPLGRLLGAEPGIQDNLMAWGSDSAHRYAAPLPPPPPPEPAPSLALGPGPGPRSAAGPGSVLGLAPPPPKDDDHDDDDDDDDDNDEYDSSDDGPASYYTTRQGKQCNGPACTHNPALLRDVRQVVANGGSSRNKGGRRNNSKRKKAKWLCWNCCWYEHGYPAAEKVWSKAKRA